MNDDIVKELRESAKWNNCYSCNRAADDIEGLRDEIERLRDEIERLRKKNERLRVEGDRMFTALSAIRTGSDPSSKLRYIADAALRGEEWFGR